MRVLHLISTLHQGGTELAMLRLIGNLDRRAYRVRVAWLLGDSALSAEVEAATGAPPIPIGLRGKIDPAAAVRLCRLLRRERIDLVHTQMDLADYYGALAARLVGARLISSKQNADEFRTRRTWKRPPFLLAERASYTAADAVIAVSEGLVDFLSRSCHLPRHKTVVIGNGVDPGIADGAPDRRAARRQLGLPAEGPILGTVGRLARQKGQIDLLRAMPAILTALPGARLLVAGDGEERDALQAETGRLGLTGSVLFLGQRSDVPAVLAALDLFVLPSLWEGMPQALLEAMAMSLPVVATRSIGSEEIVADGETGRLVPLRDPAAIARAVVETLGNRDRAMRMGEAGRQRVLALHSLPEIASRVDLLYRRVLGGRP